MSSYVWMKVLESAPERYDRGIGMLSRGHIQDVYARIASMAAGPGKQVLDIGCGTGGVSLACAERGAAVTGIDTDPGMLEVARGKPAPAQGSVSFLELGAAEIGDRFPAKSLDAVVSCLAMSELSSQEADFVLRAAHACLRPGGVLVIADETLPDGAWARLFYRLWRIPLLALTYMLTQTATRPVRNLGDRVEAAGFSSVREERMSPGNLLLICARKESS